MEGYLTTTNVKEWRQDDTGAERDRVVELVRLFRRQRAFMVQTEVRLILQR